MLMLGYDSCQNSYKGIVEMLGIVEAHIPDHDPINNL